MKVFQLILKLMAMCGCLRPRSWTSPLRKLLYTVYTIFLLVLLYTVTFFQLMDLVFVEDQDGLSENVYLMLTMMVSCYKMYSLLSKQKSIAVLINILKDEPFQPDNAEEIEIRKRYDRKALQQAFLYIAIVEPTVVLNVLKSGSNKLPYKMWLPYELHSLPIFILTYVQQAVALIIGSLMHVICDSLIWSLLIHTCSQIEILGCRLKAMKYGENHFAKSSARYHDRVYRFAAMINEEFKIVIFIQFFISTLVICLNLYTFITSKNSSSAAIVIILYACCMLVQIFFYCWYGNEVRLKSLEIPNVIFKTDWMFHNQSTKAILSMIMRRATKSIEFTSVHVVSMNLDSFVNLLKASYSMYNLLQRG